MLCWKDRIREMKFEFVEQAKNYLLDKMGAAPEVAIIMGSGLSAVDEILSRTARESTMFRFRISLFRKLPDIGVRLCSEKSEIFKSSYSKAAFTTTKATRWPK